MEPYKNAPPDLVPKASPFRTVSPVKIHHPKPAGLEGGGLGCCSCCCWFGLVFGWLVGLFGCFWGGFFGVLFLCCAHRSQHRHYASPYQLVKFWVCSFMNYKSLITWPDHLNKSSGKPFTTDREKKRFIQICSSHPPPLINPLQRTNPEQLGQWRKEPQRLQELILECSHINRNS